jgi:hypothetical protein
VLSQAELRNRYRQMNFDDVEFAFVEKSSAAVIKARESMLPPVFGWSVVRSGCSPMSCRQAGISPVTGRPGAGLNTELRPET